MPKSTKGPIRRIRSTLNNPWIQGVLTNFIAAGLMTLGGIILAVIAARTQIIALLLASWQAVDQVTKLIVLAIMFGLGLVVLSLLRTYRRHHRMQLSAARFHAPSTFVGREDSIELFREIIQSKDSPRILSIVGSPGSGKSWLLSRLAQEASNQGQICSIVDFRDSKYTPVSLLNELALQLGEDYFSEFTEALNRYLQVREVKVGNHNYDRWLTRSILDEVSDKFISALSDLANEHAVTILFDTVEEITNSQLFSTIDNFLISKIDQGVLRNLSIVFAGWEHIGFQNPYPGIVKMHNLDPLTYDDITRYLTKAFKQNLDDRFVANIYKITKGHPIILGLLTTLLLQDGNRYILQSLTNLNEMMDQILVPHFLVARIFERISSDQADALRLCALPRWFDGALIRDLVGIDNGSQAILDLATEHTAIVFPRPRSGYEFHAIIRTAILEEWLRRDPQRFQELNRRAAQHYERLQPENENIVNLSSAFLDNLYHQFVYGPSEAFKILFDLLTIASDNQEIATCEQLLRIFYEQKHYIDSYLDAPIEIWATYCKALLAHGSNNWLVAEPLFAQIEVNSLPQMVQVKLLRDIGRNQRCLYQWQPAIKSYRASLDILKTLDDRDLEGAVLNNLGFALERDGDLQAALDSYQASLKIKWTAHDTSGIAQVLNNLGNLYVKLGRLDEAKVALEESLQIWRSKDIRFQIGKALNHLGDLNKAKSDFSSAIKYYEESLDITQQMGDEYGECVTLVSLAECIFETNRADMDATMRLVSRASRLATKLGMVDQLARAAFLLGALNLYQQQSEKAFHHLCTACEWSLQDNIYELDKTLSATKDLLDEYDKSGHLASDFAAYIQEQWNRRRVTDQTLANFEYERRGLSTNIPSLIKQVRLWMV